MDLVKTTKLTQTPLEGPQEGEWLCAREPVDKLSPIAAWVTWYVMDWINTPVSLPCVWRP